MNTEQLKALFNYCERLGIKTVGQLAEFKAKAGCSTNAELLKYVTVFCAKMVKNQRFYYLYCENYLKHAKTVDNYSYFT